MQEKDEHALSLLCDEGTSGEIRTVALVQGKHDITLIEHSRGPETETLFGDCSHTRTITMGTEAEKCLVQRLGADDLVKGLRDGFSSGTLEWLSDIQDMLDCAGAPYRYVAYGPNGGLYRTQFDIS